MDVPKLKNIYIISNNNVYCRGQKIVAEFKHFKELKYGYGVDNQNLYWDGHKLNISTNYEILKNGFMKYNDILYYNGIIKKM